MADKLDGNKDRFPLADLIAVLGSELREAERRAAESGARTLQLKECSVQMGIQWDKRGSGEIDIWVVKLGGELTKQNTELITITMEPFQEPDEGGTRRRRPVARRRPVGR
jgi:Trypsin-co-occurring domain 2